MSESASADTTLALVQSIEAGLNRRDAEAVMAAMTEDCVFEIVGPVDRGGGRWEGKAAVRTAWSGFEATFPGYAFETEEVFACGDRCARRWTLRWDRTDGGRGRIRGIDVYTVRNGKIARKYSYFAL